MEKLLILIIDDEPQIRRLLRLTLEQSGYRIIEAETGKGGILEVANKQPDIIILDLGLPDIDGLEVIKQLREWSQTPIIILSVRDDPEDKTVALDNGADDYLTKPFDLSELQARIRAVSRRSQLIENVPLFEVGELKIDFTSRLVFIGNTTVHLTPIEYSILRILVQARGKIVTQNSLLKQIWGPNSEQHTEYLRVHLAHIRKALGPESSKRLKTETGIGYRFLVD